MNKIILVSGILSIILVSVIVLSNVTFEVQKESNKKLSIVEEIVISDIFSLSMENVYATGDCSEVIQKIKDRHWENINKSKYKKDAEISWYAAGLVLSAHYVVKDCDTANDVLNEYLDNLEIAHHDMGQSDIRDDIAASMRFVKSLLKK